MQISYFMSRDHDKLDSIFRMFQETEDVSKRKYLFSEFKRGLERHISWEEEILFDVFEKKNNIKSGGAHSSGPTAMMRLEHSQIKEFLDAIESEISKNKKDTKELENMLVEVLKPHNDKEEEILYPWIDESIDQKEATELLLKMQNKTMKSADQKV